MTAPLAGLVVLDLTRLLPGPAATMHLADLGADVIKVEDTGEGDYMRAFPPTVRNAAGTPVNPSYEAVNRGKRSIAIDLKRPEGRAVLLRLARRADALIEGFRPGVLERLGLGWETLHAENPKLVVCSLSGYGQTGPLAQRAGHDLNYIAMTGVLDQARVDGEPAIPNLQMGDLLGGTLSALSMLLAALLAAQRTGQGRYVDVAMTDGLLAHHFFPHAELDAGTHSHRAAHAPHRRRGLLPRLPHGRRPPPRRRRARIQVLEGVLRRGRAAGTRRTPLGARRGARVGRGAGHDRARGAADRAEDLRRLGTGVRAGRLLRHAGAHARRGARASAPQRARTGAPTRAT